MESLIIILFVIAFVALIFYSGAENVKLREEIRKKQLNQEIRDREANLKIQREVAEKFREFCKEFIFKHRFTLLANRKKFLIKDSYGRTIDKGWISIDYIKNWGENSKDPALFFFKDNVLDPELNQIFDNYPKRLFDSQGYSVFQSGSHWAYSCHEKIYSITGLEWLISEINSVCDELENKNAQFGDTSSMDGVEYEQFCKSILEEAGWVVEDTPTSGDQGVDLIASIEDLRVCIQCKCFAKPVGNKAVQEVAAGMIHWNGTHAVVVGKSGFTKSAQNLAGSNKVILISDSELENLENLVL